MATKTAAVDAKGYRKFGFRDVLAYGLGDFGCNMSFALKGTLTIFWTQYMGIDSILMASLLLLVQVWDAINDPVIGAMVDADKRQYKRNKFLAYIWPVLSACWWPALCASCPGQALPTL
ncbi:MAG: MFS transporter [Ruthenibacterium lactatiformans]